MHEDSLHTGRLALYLHVHTHTYIHTYGVHRVPTCIYSRLPRFLLLGVP